MRKKIFPIIVLVIVVIALGLVVLVIVPDNNLERVAIVANIMFVGTLVVLTAYYAQKTEEIADGTHSLAREAAQQRQRDFLPIIDIITTWKTIDPKELILIGLLKDKDEFPESISCRLMNVGRGPAFHLRYQVVHSGTIVSLVESTFLVGDMMTTIEGPRPSAGTNHKSRIPLRIENGDGGEHFVRVTYQDVFGTEWVSTKALLVGREGETELLGPLQFRPSSG